MTKKSVIDDRPAITATSPYSQETYNIRLHKVTTAHVLIEGILPDLPSYPWPLERCSWIEPGPTKATEYHNAPMWDWAGQLLCLA